MDIWKNKLVIRYLEATKDIKDISLMKKQLKELLRLIKSDGVQYTKTRGNAAIIRKIIFKRDDYKCRLCRDKQDLHIHHITPLAYGGDNSIDNIITLCNGCHKFIHLCNPKVNNYHSRLTKEGLKKAKLNGTVLGRPKSTIPPVENRVEVVCKVYE